MTLGVVPADGAILQTNAVEDVVAILTPTPGVPLPTQVTWQVQGAGASIVPATSQVSQFSGQAYATAQIQCKTPGPVTLVVQAGTETATLHYVAADLRLENEQVLTNAYAEVTPFAGPVDAGNRARVLHLYAKVVDQAGKPVAGHPVYLDFYPPVVALYQAEPPYAAVDLPRDPIGKGYIAATDTAGVVSLRVISDQPTLGQFTCTAAGVARTHRYAFVDKDTTMPSYPAIEGVDDPLRIPAQGSLFTVHTPRAVAPEGLDGLVWLRGRGGAYTYGRITSLASLRDTGDVFPYAALDNSGKALNRLAYLVQRGANTYESYPLDFAAVGDAVVDPDPHVPRTLPAPRLNTALINMAALAKGVILTIPRFAPGDIERADTGFLIQPFLYLNAWDPLTGLPKRRLVVVQLPAVAAAPAQDIEVPLADTDLLAYAFEPAPGAGVGTFKADYRVVSQATEGERYSQVLGVPAPILLETAFKTALPVPSGPRREDGHGPSGQKGTQVNSAAHKTKRAPR